MQTVKQEFGFVQKLGGRPNTITALKQAGISATAVDLYNWNRRDSVPFYVVRALLRLGEKHRSGPFKAKDFDLCAIKGAT